MPQFAADLQKKNLTRRLFFALVTPLLILLAMATVLGLALARLTKDARFVDHSDDVLAKIGEVQRQVVDQETGVRGFLLTGNRIFLEPYEQARPLEMLAELRQLVADNPEQLARADGFRSRYQLWYEGVRQILSSNKLVEGAALPAMLSRKDQMDMLRSDIRVMAASEQTLRQKRKSASAASVAMTWAELVGLFGLAAAALGLLSMRQIRGVAATYGQLLLRETEARGAVEVEAWLRAGQARVAERSQGELSVEELGSQVLQALLEYVQAEVGAFFTQSATGWQRRAGFGLDARGDDGATFGFNEGQVGRAASQKELVHLKELPAGYLAAPLIVRSGVGEHLPVEVVLLPALSDKTVFAVAELGFLRPVPQRVLDLLRRISEPLAIAVRSAQTKERLRELLEESQRQTEELQTQQEELRVFNQELEEQTSALHKANARIAERQQDLEQINARLAERTTELQRAQHTITEKAAEAERVSRYKSEFLANMSHELRTPLNSSLILAKLLSDNKEGNLTAEQVRFAETIHAAGNDLLTLINDILDLSKIEAGKAEVHPTPVHIARMIQTLGATFEPLARARQLAFAITTDPSVPQVIETDAKWLEQILRNLLSNAIKFTPKGQVAMHITSDGTHLRFVIRDSGIGIAKEQQELVFEAFRQADSASNRKYGGTGLGLSISRNLTHLLGGELTLQSEVGVGTTFTLLLPRVLPVAPVAAGAAPPPSQSGAVKPVPSSGPLLAPVRSESAAPAAALFAAAPPVPPRDAGAPADSQAAPLLTDDRGQLDRRRLLALLIEDDVHFAQILRDMAHELGFQCLIASDAEAGLALAKQHTPSAVVLDMNLPGYHGLSVLDRLKQDPALRHIPVHVISVADYTQIALSMGAIGYVLKPAKREELERVFRKLEQRLTHRVQRLLIVEADPEQRKSLRQLLEGIEVELSSVGTAAEALSRLSAQQFDCMVLDLKLPDASGFELLEKMAENDACGFPPVIVYAGRALSAEEEQQLRKFSSSIIVKGARSPERLLDEVTLFLHQVESVLPPERQRMLLRARSREALFEGRKILVVEDDVRSIFALSSLLEPRGATIVIARNGREALAVLESQPDISLVLMDIMMPEMDGLTAMREIRKNPRWAKLPIIALTAKAMADDQERCQKAGANDYITKPLNVEMLLSLLRVWMPKR